MLCAVLARNEVPFRAYSVDFGKEASLARRVAETLHVPLDVLSVFRDPGRSIPEAHEAIDCTYRVDQTWGWEMARRVAEDGCEVLLDGLAFDAILGAVHRVPADEASRFAWALKANYGDLPRKYVEMTAGPKIAEVAEECLRSSLNDEAQACMERAGPLASENFVMANRVRKYTFGYCLANLRFLPGGFPYITRELFEHCMRLPIAERLQSNLYRRIYRELFPDLAAIPWAKTGVALDRYQARRTSRVRSMFEAAARRATRGRAPWTGMNPFDQVYRTRRDFREVFDGHKYEGPAWETAEAIREAMRLELSGRNLGDLIQGLYTVDRFLRRFGPSGRADGLPEDDATARPHPLSWH